MWFVPMISVSSHEPSLCRNRSEARPFFQGLIQLAMAYNEIADRQQHGDRAGGGRNAGLLAVRILASGTDPLAARLRADLVDFAQELNDVATRKGASLRQKVSEVFADANVVTRGSR